MTDLSGFTRRQLEELQARIVKELQSCVIDSREGAEIYSITRHGAKATIMLCKPCFEKLRQPVARGDDDASSG